MCNAPRILLIWETLSEVCLITFFELYFRIFRHRAHSLSGCLSRAPPWRSSAPPFTLVMSVPPDAVWGSTHTSTGEGTRGRKRRRDTYVTRSKKRCGLRETQHDEWCSCSQDIVGIVTATARIGRSKRRRDDTRSTIRHGLRSDIVVETGN